MNYSRVIPAVAIILIVCALAVSPASLAGTSRQRRVAQSAQMVVLNVRVKDREDKSVPHLPKDGFVVTEDGVAQPITFFSNDEVPLSYGLLVDASGSFRSVISPVLSGAAKIVNSNKPTDEAFVMRFISSEKIETVQELTRDKAALVEAVNLIYIEPGQTAVNDAVYLSAEYLAEKTATAGKSRRRALIVFTDGEERNSFYTMGQLLQLLAATDIQIFAIGYMNALPANTLEKSIIRLIALATDTGGRAFFASSAADFDRISNEIINDIRTQYVIGYVPSDGGTRKDFQKVQVSIKDNSNQDNRVAITRISYSAPTK
jgi:Ca-activated chloride channel family protein